MQEQRPARLEDLPDGELVRRSREDPAGAPFRALYERHRVDVFRFVLSIARDRDLAEDLLQETFLRVYESLARFDATRAFRPWLFQIARNATLNALRARRKKERPEGDALPDRAGSDRILAQAAAGERASLAQRALAELGDEDRLLLVQRLGVGMKLEELAESLGVTERTVRNRMDVAVEKLTRALLEVMGGRS